VWCVGWLLRLKAKNEVWVGAIEVGLNGVGTKLIYKSEKGVKASSLSLAGSAGEAVFAFGRRRQKGRLHPVAPKSEEWPV